MKQENIMGKPLIIRRIK